MTDVRHLGRALVFAYDCPKCGEQFVDYDPDYPYCGPNSVATCRHCASTMYLKSTEPIAGALPVESVRRVCL